MAHHVLILGGTTEARQLAGRLAARKDLDVTLSLAGRTTNPVDQGVPVRIGGFGGADGLADYLRDNAIELLIDATHPFATRISPNAVTAAVKAGVPNLVLRRPQWQRQDGDRWAEVPTIEAAIAALGAAPRRVLVTLGRQELRPLENAPLHSYLVRSVDPVEPPVVAPDVRYILDRGPFKTANELELLKRERIDTILTKNSGGDAAYAKIAAARELGLTVVIVSRPPVVGEAVSSVSEAEQTVTHLFPPAT